MAGFDIGGLLNNPWLQVGSGLLTGAQPGGTFAGGLNMGLMNLANMQRQQQATALLGMRVQEMQRKRQEAERRAAANQAYLATLPAAERVQAEAIGAGQYGQLQEQQGFQTGLQEDTQAFQAEQQQARLDAQAQDREATRANTAAIAEQTRQMKFSDIAQSYRKDYNSENKVALLAAENYRNTKPLFEKGAEKMDGGDDISLIYAVAKLHAPAEAIMEGDKASLMGATGVPGWIKSNFSQIEGGGTFDVNTRKTLMSAAERIGSQYLDDIDIRRDNYAARYSDIDRDPGKWLPSYDRKRYEPSAGARARFKGESEIQLDENGMPYIDMPVLDDISGRYGRNRR